MNNLNITAGAAKSASVRLATASSDEKNRALEAIAKSLTDNAEAILTANKIDVEAARSNGTPESMIDRLSLSPDRIEDIAEGVRQVAALPDPVGEIVEEFSRPNGLNITKTRVPLGVIGMIYEARPNVTVDSAALALKSGNAILLRGSSSAARSNEALVDIMKGALESAGFDAHAIGLVDSSSRESVNEMLTLRGLIDLIIPRGGAGLIRAVVENAKVPVLETGVGNCHVYVDKAADYEMAEKIVINAKTNRPSVCNAAETILIHKDFADVSRLLEAIRDAGVQIHGCERVCALADYAVSVGEKDYEEEYLSLDVAVKIVDDIDEAISHIRRYSSRHTEAIVTDDDAAAEKFMLEIDSACVNHNASTRFTDGFQFGFGAEIGISTQKMHARGPVGLKELTSYKYLVRGNGQIRS